MPLDEHARALLDSLAADLPRSAARLVAAQRRAAFQRLFDLGGEPERVARVEKRFLRGPDGALRVCIYTPAGAPAGLLPGLVYFHGGGFIGGTLETHDGVCRSLANASGCRVVAVDYRVGPEAPFPAALLDASVATRWVGEHGSQVGIDGRRFGVGGDSSGATLAAAVAQAMVLEGGPALALQYLLCPVLVHGAETPSRAEFGSGYLLEREMLEHSLRHDLGEGARADDPRVSPLRATHLEGLPPACIHTAECDPLRDEGAAYAERLERAGVRVLYRCHPGMIHLFYRLPAAIPYAATAFRAIGADIRSLLEPPPDP